MKLYKKIFTVLLILILIIIYANPIISNATNNFIGNDALIKLNINGTDRTVTKTTTVDAIKSWYSGQHILETTSLFGGSAYSFWCGDKYDDYLYIETLEDGTIFSYGSVDKTYKTNTYSYGDSYPYQERNSLYGCLTSDDGKVVGGVYYNKVPTYLNSNARKIINAYKEAFEEDQKTALLNLNKHATPMFNAMMNEYGSSQFLTFNEEFFNKDLSLKEEGSSLAKYAIDMENGKKIYTNLGSKGNMDLAYSTYYILNPLIFAGMAKIKKNADLGQTIYPVWSYNYEKKTLIGASYSQDCLVAEYEMDEKDLNLEKVILEAFTSIDDKMSTINKAQNLINYMVEDVEYTSKDRVGRYDYNALVKRGAVCEDSASGTNTLLRRAGIPSYKIRNIDPEVNHAWNIYNIDGEWTYGDNVFHLGWEPARIEGAYFYSKSDISNPLNGFNIHHEFTGATCDLNFDEFPEGKKFNVNPSGDARIYIDDNYYYCSTDWHALGNGSIGKIDRNNNSGYKGIVGNKANGFAKKGDRIYYIKADRKTVASCDLNGQNERIEKVFNDCEAGDDSPKRLDGMYAKDGLIRVYYHEKGRGFTQDEECVITTTDTYPTQESKIYNDSEHKYKMIYLKNDTAVEILKLVGINGGEYAEGKIEIPEKIEGLPVVGIGPRAFTGIKLSGEVSLPSTIRFIGREAFNNANITAINLNEGLKSIENYAFKSANIEKINLPTSLTYIGEEVFSDNDKLTSIEFPENLQIANNVISERNRCDNLTSVAYKNDNMDIISGLSSYEGTFTNYDVYATPGSKTESILKKGQENIYDIKDFGNHFVKKYFILDSENINPINVVIPGQLQGTPAELEDGTFVQVKYKSNNPDVIKITSDGYSFQSTGKPGFATITAENTDGKYGNLEYIVFSKYRGDYNLPLTNGSGNTYADKSTVFCGDLNNNTAWDTGDLDVLKRKIEIHNKANNITQENIPLYDINGDGNATNEDYDIFKDIIYNQRMQIGSIPITDISTSDTGLDLYESWQTFEKKVENADYIEHNFSLVLNGLYPYPSNTTEKLKIVDVKVDNEKIVQFESIDENGTVTFKCLSQGSTSATFTTDKGITKTIYNIIVDKKSVPYMELKNKSVKSIEVEEFNTNLKVGDEIKLDAISYPLAVNSGKVEYTSSDYDIVDIDDNGNLEALKPGTTTITIQAGEKKEEYEVTVTEKLKGDVNGDGKVNAGDYVAILNYVRKKIKFTDEQLQKADVNGDGKVNAGDYVTILNIVRGKI